MKDVLIFSIIVFLLGILLFLIFPFLKILFLKFKKIKNFEKIEKIFLEILNYVLLTSFLIFMFSLGFIIVKTIKINNENKQKDLNNIIKTINDRQYKVYQLCVCIDDYIVRKFFLTNEEISKKIIFFDTVKSNFIMMIYLSKDELNLKNTYIPLSKDIIVNPSFIKVINNKEFIDILNSKDITLKIKEILKNE